MFAPLDLAAISDLAAPRGVNYAPAERPIPPGVGTPTQGQQLNAHVVHAQEAVSSGEQLHRCASSNLHQLYHAVRNAKLVEADGIILVLAVLTLQAEAVEWELIFLALVGPPVVGEPLA